MVVTWTGVVTVAVLLVEGTAQCHVCAAVEWWLVELLT